MADVQKAIAGQDSVFCAIGGSGLGDATTRTIGTRNIIQAMKETDARSLVVCSAMGQGKSKKHLSLVGKMVLNTILRKPMQDHASQEKLIIESDLDWTIVRPPRLTDGEKTEKYRVADENEPFSASQTSRADVAHFMLRVLQEKEWIQKAMSISL